jgi:hypothetical protein
MFRKYVLPILALFAIIALFVMYRNQRRLYKKTLQANYSLATHLRELQQKDLQMTQGLQQIREAREDAPRLKGTFIDQKKYFRQNWTNYIHAAFNDYKTGLLGGIKGARIIVRNDTEFPLDDVTAVVQYYRANGKMFRSTPVNLGRINAKSAKTVPVADSRRGMSLKLQLSRITSQEMNFCWSRDKKVSPGDNDPYQCVATSP